MSNELFSIFQTKNIYFNDFRVHFDRLDEATLSKIKDHFIPEMTEISGLYSFAKFLFKKIMLWEGSLHPELVYLTTKALVLAGLNDEARKVARGFDFHIGCLSWLVGSYYREPKTKKFNNLLHELTLAVSDQERNLPFDIAFSDAIGWLLAYVPIEDCLNLYNKYKSYFLDSFPIYILLERFIKENRLKSAFFYLNDVLSRENLEKNSILNNLILNKEATLYQLTGNQDKAIITFEMA